MKIENESEYFYAYDGAVLKSIDDLISYLRSVSGESFSHHVSAEKNDFANWIAGIFKDVSLAEKLSGLDSSQDFLAVLESKPKKRRTAAQKKQNIIAKIQEAFS